MAAGKPPSHPRHPALLLEDGAPASELSSMSRFALTWAPEPSLPFQTPLGHAIERSGTLSSSDGESDHSEREFNDRYSRDEGTDYDATANPHFKTQQSSLPMGDRIPDPNRLSRTFSMPLPSQLEHLQNPRRVQEPFSPYSDTSSPSDPLSNVSRLHELSLELADSVQMVVQTLLQISPAQILDPAKEQYAACSLLVPTTCMSAMFTTMKHLNFVSGNMSDLFVNSEPPPPARNGLLLSPASKTPITVSDFDIGEMLQGVGDTLSGCAAQIGVNLVLFHGDVGLKHVAVRGEEFALSTTLTHVSISCKTHTPISDTPEGRPASHQYCASRRFRRCRPIYQITLR